MSEYLPEMDGAPYDARGERALLGSCILGGFRQAVEDHGVGADWFYDLRHAELWQAMETVDSKGGTINEAALAMACDWKPLELLNMADGSGTAANVSLYVEQVRDAYFRRRAWQELQEISARVRTTQTPTELPLAFESAFLKLAEARVCEDRDQKRSLKGYIEFLQSAYPDGLPSVGHETGIHDLDVMLRSYGPGTMNIIAARPGCGKTSFAVQLALKFAKAASGGTVLFYSLEMPYNEVMTRCLSHHCGANVADYLHTGKGSVPRLLDGMGELARMPLHVEDRPDVSIAALRNQVRRLVKTKNVTSVFIDYLQLLNAGVKLDNRAVEVGYVSRQLKMLAKEFSLPVICLAQLNREVEARAGRPRLSDLRESGSIEQDADTVMFLAPSKDEDNLRSNESPVDCYLEKNRSGMTGHCRLAWVKETNTFEGFTEATSEY